MTAQQIYNKVKKHLLKQKCRATDKNGHCLYRGEGGLKCAVGALIPDSKYKSKFEMHGVSLLIDMGCKFLLATDLKGVDVLGRSVAKSFLNDLQEVHDCRSVKDWDYHLADVALSYGLEP